MVWITKDGIYLDPVARERSEDTMVTSHQAKEALSMAKSIQDDVDKTSGSRDALTAAREKAKQGQTVSRDVSETREAYINEVHFSGRLGRPVEYAMTPTGKELAKTSLAVFNPGDDKNTMWFDLVMWLQEEGSDKWPANQTLFEHYLNMSQGDAVVVKGRLTMRLYNEKTFYTITLTDIG